VTHDVWLQVASELGIFGLLIFAFLVVRAFRACLATARLLRGPRRRRGKPADAASALAVTDPERRILEQNARGMLAAMVGWTVCSLFASVAFNWTFYYVLALAVAGRDIAKSRMPQTEPAAEPSRALPRVVGGPSGSLRAEPLRLASAAGLAQGRHA
jgi:O-antigen ligase